jgi:hypothetical protein
MRDFSIEIKDKQIENKYNSMKEKIMLHKYKMKSKIIK